MPDLGYWVETTDQSLRDLANKVAGREPKLADELRQKRTYSTYFDTTDPNTLWPQFLHNPMQFLKTPAKKGMGIKQIFEDDGMDRWTMSTVITNHHRPLNPRIVVFELSLNGSSRKADGTATKHEP